MSPSPDLPVDMEAALALCASTADLPPADRELLEAASAWLAERVQAGEGALATLAMLAARPMPPAFFKEYPEFLSFFTEYVRIHAELGHRIRFRLEGASGLPPVRARRTRKR